MVSEHPQSNAAPQRSFPGEVFHLPGESALPMLFEALNLLEEPVLIADRDSTIRYVNTSYLRTYGSGFAAIGIASDAIIGQRLCDLPNPGQNVQLMLDVMESSTPHYTFCTDISEGNPVVADLIPLCVDGRAVGIVSIMRSISHIVQLSRQISHYKKLTAELQQALDAKERLPDAFRSIIGHAPDFLQMLRRAATVAPASTAVCITGESGTGKEGIAEAIHYASKFAAGPLVKVNCAAITESLAESELFGYVGGSFTGSNPRGSPGKFELANDGTLFLDEIGELPLSMQAKLLRVLQDHTVTRIGGTEPVQLNFRLITATNRDLKTMVAQGTFREDLYYRINVITLAIPPLRERRQDIPRLARYFLTQFQEELGRRHTFTEEVLEALTTYDWPGNVRELKNCVEYMATLAQSETIDTDLLPIQYFPRQSAPSHPPEDSSAAEKEETRFYLQNILDRAEREAIHNALTQCGGNKSRAIRLLGTSRQNFYLKLKKYGLIDVGTGAGHEDF